MDKYTKALQNIVLGLTSILSVAPTYAIGCMDIVSAKLRLECFESQSDKISSPTDASGTPSLPTDDSKKNVEERPRWQKAIRLRDSLSPRAEPASFAVARSNGETVYKTDIALAFSPGNMLLPDSLRKLGWEWQLGAEVHRHTSAQNPVNGQVLQLAMRGTFHPTQTAVVNTVVGIERVVDHVEDLRTTGVRMEGVVNFLNSWLDYGIPHSAISSYRGIFPLFGLHLDRVQGTMQEGTLYGGHIGVRAQYYPGFALKPVRLFGEAVRAQDFGRNGNLQKRSSTFYRFGISLVLLNEPTSGFIPSLTLQRTIGANFLEGISDTARTDLLFTLSFN